MIYGLRLSSLATIVLATLAGACLFWVSQQVQQLEREQRQAKSDLEQEREALRVLTAEWDYLNRPDRLEVLVSRYLEMAPATPDNLLKNASAIPEPSPIPPEIGVPTLASTNAVPGKDRAVPAADFEAVLDNLGVEETMEGTE